VSVGPGDALLIHTATSRASPAEGVHPQQHHPPAAACLPYLHERDIADAGHGRIKMSSVRLSRRQNLTMPVHNVALVALGPVADR